MNARAEFVHRGLIEALGLLRRPTDRPDLDNAEILARIRDAAEFIRLEEWR